MKLKPLLLLGSHVGALGIGVALGIYLLPILAAPPPPTAEQVAEAAVSASYTGAFVRDLQDSDALHWGEGEVFVSETAISLKGEIAPGPAYVLYLAKDFIETESEFLAQKEQLQPVGSIQVFENFIVPVPRDVNVHDFNTVIVWCEAFSEFITASRYRAL